MTSDEKRRFIQIDGPGLLDAAYHLRKTPLGRQAPLRTTSVRFAERGLKPSVEIPERSPGMPFITSTPESKD